MNKQIYNYAVEKLINTTKISLGDIMWNNGKNSTDSLKVLRRLWRDGIVRECENGEYELVDIRVLSQYREVVKDADCHTENALRYRAQMITKKEYETLARIAADERCSLVDDNKEQVELYYKLLDRRLCYTFNGLVHCDLTENDLKIVKKMIGVTPDEKPTPEEVEKKKEELRARQKAREEEKKKSGTLDDAIRRFNERNKGLGIIDKPTEEKTDIDGDTPIAVSIVFDRFGINPYAIKVNEPARHTVEYFIKSAYRSMLPANQIECVGRDAYDAIDNGKMSSALSAFLSRQGDTTTKAKKISMRKTVLSLLEEGETDGIVITVKERDEITEELDNERYALQVSLCANDDEVARCDITVADTQTARNAFRGALLKMIKSSNGNGIKDLQDAFAAIDDGKGLKEYGFFVVEIKDGEEKVTGNLYLERPLKDNIFNAMCNSSRSGIKTILRMTKHDIR